ncbi:hypothetical protein ACFXG4_23570 [Nocardia sp. NPDC059246]|uniref:hypothetical protein n=1 Tax=unclassified Nocardia TaxID=2637762 RepID=UPI0036958769
MTSSKAEWQKGKSGIYAYLSILDYGASVTYTPGIQKWEWRVTHKQKLIASGTDDYAAEAVFMAEAAIKLHHRRRLRKVA